MKKENEHLDDDYLNYQEEPDHEVGEFITSDWEAQNEKEQPTPYSGCIYVIFFITLIWWGVYELIRYLS
jgi:hypothetical protein